MCWEQAHPEGMEALLIEPWWRGSHRRWAEGWAAHSRHRIEVVSVPTGSWRWRLRAGAVPLAAAAREHLRHGIVPDVVVVSGLVDVAQLLGFLRRELAADVPVVVMQHESQLVHPRRDGGIDAEAALRNWLSWRAADRVWWNSAFHRDAVLAALRGWLASIPDHDRGGSPAALVADLADRSEVVGLGVTAPPLAGEPLPAAGHDGPIVLWPHRWEWDKDPDGFVAAIRRLIADGVDVGVVLAGEEPTIGVSGRAAFAAELGDHLVAMGPFDHREYRSWLGRSDLVVSCSRHEFFGLAVVEAMAAGCRPVVPDALAYPEVVPPDIERYRPGTFGSALRRAIEDPPSDEERRRIASDVLERHGWPVVTRRMDDSLERLVGGASA